MPKYIDVDAFVEKKREQYCAACERRMGVRNGHAGMIYEIGDAPCRACWVDDMLGDVEDFPAADVQKVVRCKDCGNNYGTRNTPLCHFYPYRLEPNSFCSDGYKRMDESEGE